MAKERARYTEFEDPRLAKFLFGSTAMAWVWLVARSWLGYKWIEAGWLKVTDPRWVGDGSALKGFWERAVAIPEQGRPAIAFDWYRDFLNYLLSTESYTWFAKLISYGELLVGIALVLGAFVGVAALFGAFMNFNFLLAGSASTNPVLFLIAIFLILAWKTAGYIGLDNYLLPLIGTPWKRGRIFRGNTQPTLA